MNRLAIATFLLGLTPWCFIALGFLAKLVFLQLNLQETRRGDVVDIVTSAVACLQVNTCWVSPLAYITGMMSLNQIRNSQGTEKGRWAAIAGMILVTLLIIPFAYSL
jgi:hypothetical protein